MTAINPSERQRRTAPIEVRVDTGSKLSWLPKKELLDIGIMPEGKKRFAMANKQIIERDFGYAILTAEGYTPRMTILYSRKTAICLF